MRENRPSGSMSGKWKRSMVGLVRHRQTKEPVTDRPHLNHRATSRLYLLCFLRNCARSARREWSESKNRKMAADRTDDTDPRKDSADPCHPRNPRLHLHLRLLAPGPNVEFAAAKRAVIDSQLLYTNYSNASYSSPKFSPPCLEGLFPSHRKAGRGKLCGWRMRRAPSGRLLGLGGNTHRPATNHASQRLRRFRLDVRAGAMRFGSLTNPQTRTTVRVRLSIRTSPNQSQRVPQSFASFPGSRLP